MILLREDATDTGHDLALVTTGPTATAAALITRMIRWWMALHHWKRNDVPRR